MVFIGSHNFSYSWRIFGQKIFVTSIYDLFFGILFLKVATALVLITIFLAVLVFRKTSK